MRLIGKVLAVLFGLCLLAVVTDLVWGKIEEHRFNARVAALKARGEPVSLTDTRCPPVADSQNAVSGLRKAFDWLHADPTRNEPVNLWRITDPSTATTNEDRAKFRAYFHRIAPYFQQVEQALTRPKWRFRRGAGLGQDIAVMREAAEMYVDRACTNNAATALTQHMEHAARVCLALGRERPPDLLGTLIQFTIRTQPLESLLRGNYRLPGFDAVSFRGALDPELKQAIPDSGPPPEAFVEERAYLISAIRSSSDGAGLWLPWYYRSWYGRPFFYGDATRELDLLERVQHYCNQTPEAIAQSWRTILPGAPEGPICSASMSRRFFGLYARKIAQMRLLRVVLGLLEVQQETGKWPTDLRSLDPHFPAGIPKDPFTGGPFAYKRTPSGAQLRSAAADDSDLSDDSLVWDLRKPAEK